MKSFNRKSLIIFFCSVLLLLALLFISWYLFIEIKNTSKVIANASSESLLLEEREREFGESSASLQSYSHQIENLNKAFLNETSFVKLIELFEDISKEAGVGFKALDAKLPTAEGDQPALSFEVEGDRTRLTNFFLLADKLPYAGFLENVLWTRQGKGTDTIRVSASYIVFNYIK